MVFNIHFIFPALSTSAEISQEIDAELGLTENHFSRPEVSNLYFLYFRFSIFIILIFSVIYTYHLFDMYKIFFSYFIVDNCPGPFKDMNPNSDY